MDMETLKNEIEEMLSQMGFRDEVASIDSYQGLTNRLTVRIRGSANMLIGEHGDNLAALEHVLRKVLVKKYGREAQFTLDINDYRLKHLEDLKQDVKDAAKAVRIQKKEVPLRPMSSFERRIVHLLLAEYPDIATESVGQEPERRVVIKPYPFG
ncbi:MAG: hypothetical protein HY221_02680 [Candidatus Sungbacteria bacterium]|uniref:R3H domain-containing protein n=1 Tax=Candidatus Sungiibacteriota bacterium TaxID=2750080 RepID=A0A932QYK1_9BACT|nr:hypothetical protein [Candidatus Sungbacteria bacterium]